MIVNCAGLTVGGPDVLAAANITGTYTLVRAMLLAETPARLVHLGSAAEYGRAEPGVPLSESAPPRPGAPYGATKLAGTRLVELGRAAGLDAVVLRVFNPVGAGAPESGLPGRVAAQLRRALAGDAEVRLGPLDAVRDFIDARDVAAAVLAAAHAPALPHAVLNIGSGTAMPARTLVKELIAVTGYAGPVHEDSAGLGAIRRPGLAAGRHRAWPAWTSTGGRAGTWRLRWTTCGRQAVRRRSTDRMQLDTPRLVVPAYFRPDLKPDDWELLAQHGPQVRLVILNMANGPGTGPDPAYAHALDRLRQAGVAIAGYVDTNYGQRQPREALAELEIVPEVVQRGRRVLRPGLHHRRAPRLLRRAVPGRPLRRCPGGDVQPRRASARGLRRARQPARHLRRPVAVLPSARRATVDAVPAGRQVLPRRVRGAAGEL